MPPLLAALFLIEFSCSFQIIQAIDLNMEWRQFPDTCFWPSLSWYRTCIGDENIYIGNRKVLGLRGTYFWPNSWAEQSRKYNAKNERLLFI